MLFGALFWIWAHTDLLTTNCGFLSVARPGLANAISALLGGLAVTGSVSALRETLGQSYAAVTFWWLGVTFVILAQREMATLQLAVSDQGFSRVQLTTLHCGHVVLGLCASTHK